MVFNLKLIQLYIVCDLSLFIQNIISGVDKFLRNRSSNNYSEYAIQKQQTNYLWRCLIVYCVKKSALDFMHIILLLMRISYDSKYECDMV